MAGWIWLRRDALTALHAEQLAEHGGAAGVRDEGLLESALARPENMAAYGEPDLFELAAAYAFGIVKNHPFVDGNKRAGFMAAATFLLLNGWTLTATDKEVVEAMLALAAGEASEEEFALWLKANCKKA
ncbi:type II toxin-antitoxin system death-on-curing family toxin [Amphiplicatus metriothermophilus]|uniref:Death on curing protein n=1 Tax=Amphiplicatus metriothermophilus TaxID=1519374 RepID=A0A239PJ16_9PROT|nr:type II toxin-antitoxin system death-on-curing family toxin [Amphiplicatus metriothermophilus]SNT67560.1 death on curing protein [Amphiplicatus metriothermophilus]